MWYTVEYTVRCTYIGGGSSYKRWSCGSLSIEWLIGGSWIVEEEWTEEQRSEAKRPVTEHVIQPTAWFFDSTRTASAEAGSDRFCGTCSHGCQSVRSLVSGVVKRSSCQSIMLWQEELVSIKAISTLQLSPALLRELGMALSRRKKSVVPAGSRSTTSGSVARASQRPSSQLAGKRKSNELASSGDSS